MSEYIIIIIIIIINYLNLKVSKSVKEYTKKLYSAEPWNKKDVKNIISLLAIFGWTCLWFINNSEKSQSWPQNQANYNQKQFKSHSSPK
jgi:uncharacterized membrane protein